uniref:Uncharacterized protein n=1 Tax=uncultured marine group II/III euryarchaeote KM3_18_D06 TaxID=1457956 RepID=A0A075GPW7_9EURY|nr:hypothetical protein [uncultured marine group II/III euryarchaeote KM3_18_D06]
MAVNFGALPVPIVDESADERTPWLVEALERRFQPTNRGLIVETRSHGVATHFLRVAEFELWLGEVEEQLQLTLGRRLAHAAAESEEWRQSASDREPPTPFFKRQQKQLEWANEDLQLRGLGNLELLSSSDKSAKLLVRDRAHPAIAAGIAASLWEKLANKRYRFHWTDDGASESLVTLDFDSRSIPSAEPVDGRWQNAEGTDGDMEGMHPLSLARHEGLGNWTIDGGRMMSLSQDLIVRFEETALPHLTDKSRQAEPTCEWNGVTDSERVKLWDAFAEASRNRFIASGEMVLVAEPEHWVHVGHRFLSRTGLGGVDTAETLDEHGGVRLTLKSVFHPAMTVGTLLGAWERAEARPASVRWSQGRSGHIVELRPRHDIAQD